MPPSLVIRRWWLKSGEKTHRLDVWKPKNNGINYQPQLVSRISVINSTKQKLPQKMRCSTKKHHSRCIFFTYFPTFSCIKHEDMASHFPFPESIFQGTSCATNGFQPIPAEISRLRLGIAFGTMMSRRDMGDVKLYEIVMKEDDKKQAYISEHVWWNKKYWHVCFVWK